MPIDLPYTDGAPNLLPHIDPSDPIALFKLIWTDDLLKELAAYINKYIKLHPFREYKDKNKRIQRPRLWQLTTAKELFIYLAVTIYMGLSPELDIEDYWRITHRKAVDYFAVREYMSKNC